MNISYEEWIKKFDKKDGPKTTDDCYTPREVFEFVEDYFCKFYDIDPAKVIRPFYPGGDYEHEDYEGKVVIDNPPFSILAKIIEFYQKHNIKFVLFCSAQHGTTRTQGFLTYHMGGQVRYENGAKVNTAFVTNMNEEDAIISDMQFRNTLADMQRRDRKLIKYADNEITLATFGRIDYTLKKRDCVREIHEQNKKAFGRGYVVTDEAAKEIKERKGLL